jgi:hypothetical protein
MNQLSNAKVGDKVIICRHLGDEEVGVIEKITPKGYLKVGGCLYYTNGVERATGWYTSSIKLATDEEIEKLEKRKFRRKVLNKLHALKDISYEQAILIENILENS